MDRYSLVRVSGPAEEPVSLGDARAHLRMTDANTDPSNSQIQDWIQAAREAAEDFTRRCFCYSHYELALDAFPTCGLQEVRLPRPPLLEVTKIEYVDPDGVLQELGSGVYQVDARSTPGRIRPAPDQAWPATRYQMNAVVVSYIAGYRPSESGSPTDYAANVPAAVKSAIKLVLGHLNENRENVVIVPGQQPIALPKGAEHLLWPHRVLDFGLSA